MIRLWGVSLVVACSTNPPPEGIVSPPPTAPAEALPWLDDAMAIEVESVDHERRSTRDPEAVGAVVAALRGATWTPGGLPRCRPALWLRVVPPAAEDGVTALFCGPTQGGFAHVPGIGGFALDDAGSRALYDAAVPIGRATGGAIPPTAVTSGLGTLSIAIGRGERRVEVSRAAGTLDEATAGAAVDALNRAGFFARAERFHAGEGAAAPAGSKPGPVPAASGAWVDVSVAADTWTRTWHEEPADAVFLHTLDTLARAPGLESLTAALATLR